jgi:putative mRNA 3-end processing factor
MDAVDARSLSFVSHALVPGAQEHNKIISTSLTADLLRALAAVHGRGRRAHEPQALVTPYQRPFQLGQLSLELVPSGHVLGGASLLIRHEGQTIVYAGDINPRASRLADRLVARPCEVLALPCRLCQRQFVLPPAEEVERAVVRFVSDALDRRQTPVLLCSPLGEAQELADLLLKQGVKVQAHRQIHKVCQVYREAGLGLDGVRYFRQPPPRGALLWPMELHASPTLDRLQQRRTALVSGLALDPRVAGRVGCDTTFPIASRADYQGLLEYVRACKPSRVVLVGTEVGDLQDDLRGLGLAVATTASPRQMALF